MIALTHMRTHNDIKLANEIDNIDLILGGHDHVHHLEQVNGTFIIKSGCDFREFSSITLTPIDPLKEDHQDTEIYKKEFMFSHEQVIVDSSWEQDQEMKEHIEHYD